VGLWEAAVAVVLSRVGPGEANALAIVVGGRCTIVVVMVHVRFASLALRKDPISVSRANTRFIKVLAGRFECEKRDKFKNASCRN